MNVPVRHIVHSNERAQCGVAFVSEHHPKVPGVPMHQRALCAKCLLAVNAARAERQGWRVKV